MRLNTLKAAPGSRPNAKRVGRGIGSGLGKTCGRGHKGQKSRAGGYHKVGFEGGQMPIQRRLPKRGFNSPTEGDTAQIRLHELAKVEAGVIDMDALRKANLVSASVKKAKVFLSGKLEKAVVIKGIALTKGAEQAITQAGGKVEN
ncbi:MAG: 50S ribosomal protein L15 [Gammaproteobacteria bacterium]|nr:50S ribosomal protein L15 [Gammaproteobacteria bacterium]